MYIIFIIIYIYYYIYMIIYIYIIIFLYIAILVGLKMPKDLESADPPRIQQSWRFPFTDGISHGISYGLTCFFTIHLWKHPFMKFIPWINIYKVINHPFMETPIYGFPSRTVDIQLPHFSPPAGAMQRFIMDRSIKGTLGSRIPGRSGTNVASLATLMRPKVLSFSKALSSTS